MPDPQATSPAPLVLIGDAHEWSARSLDSILSPRGYRVRKLHTGADLLAAAAREADAILLQLGLPDTDAVALVRALRDDSRVGSVTPIVLAAARPLPRQLRVAALRAGATDLWGLPMDTDELVLRLEAVLRAKVAAVRARDEGLVDSATGFYNQRGVVRRAEDLAAQAARRHAALGCVVLAPAAVFVREAVPVRHFDAAVAAVTQGLKNAARTTDAVGRIGPTEFAVLAPDADALGARELAGRLVVAIRRASGAQAPSRGLDLCAGYHGVDDFRASGLGPLDLLVHATSALRVAETRGPGGAIHGFTNHLPRP